MGVLDTLYGAGKSPTLPADRSPTVEDISPEMQIGELPPPEVKGYRADPDNKSGGTDNLETLPTHFNSSGLAESVKAMVKGAKYGVPQLPAKDIAALALKEGNHGLGVDPVEVKDDKGNLTHLSPYDPNMKGDKDLYDNLKKENLTDTAASFAIRLANKSKVSERLKKPLAELWNGTGVGDNKQTGKDYADSMKDFVKAAGHAKNKDLLNFIQKAIDESKD